MAGVRLNRKDLVIAKIRIRPYFGRGNFKLGREFVTWSLPAVLTCPGRTEACSGVDEKGSRRCYATKGFMLFQIERFKANLKLARTTHFKHWALGELQSLPEGTVVRLHVSGDFFSKKYIESWTYIIDRCPHLIFYFYTRSWRVPSLRPSIDRLAERSNVAAWYSVDRDDSPKDIPPRVRVAYMQITADDNPKVPVDLVFRDYALRKQLAKKVDGTVVCPHEQGAKHSSKISCESCRICVDPLPQPEQTTRTPLTMAA